MTDNTSFTAINASVDSGNASQAYYDPNKDQCTLLARLAINTGVAGGVCFLGLAGNALSFAVLRLDKQTPVASLLLQALAATDSFFLALWFVHFSINDLLEYAGVDQYARPYWMYARLYSYPLLFIAQTATVWLTVLIAFTRFVAICVPYRASQLCSVPMVQRAVAGVGLFSVLSNLPRFFDTRIVHVIRHGRDMYYFSLSPLGDSATYRLLYVDIAYYLLSFVLPLLILAVLNTKLTLAYRRVQQRRRHLRSGGNTSSSSDSGSGHNDPNITLVMIIVVLVFMLCNLPARVVQIVWKYRDQACMSAEFFVKEISNVLEVLNSSTNFIIYCVFRRQFRDILRHQLCGFGRHRRGVEDGDGTDNTMHTLLNGYGKDRESRPDNAKRSSPK